MGWYTDLINFATDEGSAVNDFLASDLVSGLATTAVGSAFSDYFQPDIPKVGYQGTVPELQAVRERVPMQQPAEGQAPRRPGSAGRRYFSDTQYAKRPDTEMQTVAEAQARAQAQAQQLAQAQAQAQAKTPASQQPQPQPSGGPRQTVGMAAGGVASAYNRRHNGYYLGGKTDGMADEVPASIDGKQEARLSDGEFVIPADVVSHLGNGNSDAGSQQLYGMMDNIREARTGNPEQGKQIDPNKFMPTMAQGGIAQAYNYGGKIQKFAGEDGSTVGGEGDAGTQPSDPLIGKEAGTENSLSTWAGDYVTDMLGQGKALGNQAYQGYEGPLSAGTNAMQDQAYAGLGALEAPTGMGAYTPQTFGAEQATAGMNPYLMASLNPQLDEARRQSEIDRVANAGRMTQAGSFGGSRQALMDMENTRNLQSNLANITGQGYATAYDKAREQFNTEQGRGMEAQNAANQYGFNVLGAQGAAGAEQRAIESEGMKADYAQFAEERKYPYTQVQYMQSLLQGLPVQSQSTSYTQPSQASQTASTIEGLGELYKKMFGGGE